MQAVLLNDTSTKRHHGCRLVMSQIRRYCGAAGIDINHNVPNNEDWRSTQHKDQVAEADTVIINGEGTLHHSRPKALILASCAQFCRDRGIKSFLINSVYQDNNDEIADLVRLFDLIFVRESESKAALQSQNIRAEIVPDMSLSMADAPVGQAGTRKGIIFSDSRDREVASFLYDMAANTEGARFITLTPPSPGRRSNRASSRLKTLAMRIVSGHARIGAPTGGNVAKVGRISEIRQTLPELLNMLAKSRLVVTGRFHMVCLALLTKTPFLALSSNTHKVEGILNDVGLAHRFVAPRTLHEALGQNSTWKDGEEELVERYLRHARRSINDMFKSIKSNAGVV